MNLRTIEPFARLCAGRAALGRYLTPHPAPRGTILAPRSSVHFRNRRWLSRLALLAMAFLLMLSTARACDEFCGCVGLYLYVPNLDGHQAKFVRLDRPGEVSLSEFTPMDRTLPPAPRVSKSNSFDLTKVELLPGPDETARPHFSPTNMAELPAENPREASSNSGSLTPVPEPSGLWLGIVGLVLPMFWRHRLH